MEEVRLPADTGVQPQPLVSGIEPFRLVRAWARRCWLLCGQLPLRIVQS